MFIEKNWGEQKQSPELFYKKDVLKNVAKFKGKYLCWSLFYASGRTVMKKYLEGWVERDCWQKEQPIRVVETARSAKKL